MGPSSQTPRSNVIAQVSVVGAGVLCILSYYTISRYGYWGDHASTFSSKISSFKPLSYYFVGSDAATFSIQSAAALLILLAMISYTSRRGHLHGPRGYATVPLLIIVAYGFLICESWLIGMLAAFSQIS